MATAQERRRARYMRKHAHKMARALARTVPSFAARQLDAKTRERCARAIADAAVDLTGAVFDALVRASPAPDGQAVQAGEAEEAQGGAPAKVSPRDIWRAPTLVNWCLLGDDSSARDKAEADLDAAFAKTSAWLRAQLQAGRRDALDEAFDDLGPVMLAHIKSGAMDTEPCANVRLALREVACQAQLAPTTTARLRCCQFHGLGGDERHGCGGDALPRIGPRPRPPGSVELVPSASGLEPRVAPCAPQHTKE